MKHAIIVLLAALITVVVVLIIYRPDLIIKYWLWIIGLIGPLVLFIQKAISKISNHFRDFTTKNQ